ncbi:MAG TPA: hypothetical protein VJZ73_13255 [Methylomirabilota bacterium]|nr:hypothetical protein [Methylomirabilota bacterium]
MQKINRILTWPLLFLVLLAPATALAATDPPTPDTDAAAWVKALYEAVTSKKWSVVVGFVLVGLVYVARRWALGWVAWFKTPFGGLVLGFLIALAGTMGIALAAGVQPSLALVATSLSSAAVAAGVWEWLKAHIPGVQTAADKAVTPPALAKLEDA